jgi:hypothetical protein
MTDEQKEDITKVAVSLVLSTFAPHGYVPDELEMRTHPSSDDEHMLVLIVVKIIPVSGTGNPVSCAGTLRLNHADESLRLHLVTAPEFSELN